MNALSRGGKGEGLGSGGHCVCPNCGGRIPHRSGVPCQEERCPTCGAKMLREGSTHHRLWKKNKGEG
jgi:predicted amidophosphoribosyltransferase